jgi:hypothetical protein
MKTWEDGDFTTAAATGPRVRSYPISGDTESFVITQPFSQLLEFWNPLSLDTPDELYRDAYLVEESAPSHIGGTVGAWTRTFARIPLSYHELEPFVYTVPGVTDNPTVLVRNVYGFSSSAGVTTITFLSAHNFTVGDPVLIDYWVKDNKENLFFNREVFRLVATIPNTTTITVELISEPNPIVVMNSVRPAQAGRKPFQRVVQSWLQTDFFLPGISVGITSANDIPLFEAWKIIDNTGNISDTLSATSQPTLTEYRTMVNTKQKIVAEPSQLKRWKGNIWQRTTRYVVAS